MSIHQKKNFISLPVTRKLIKRIRSTPCSKPISSRESCKTVKLMLFFALPSCHLVKPQRKSQQNMLFFNPVRTGTSLPTTMLRTAKRHYITMFLQYVCMYVCNYCVHVLVLTLFHQAFPRENRQLSPLFPNMLSKGLLKVHTPKGQHLFTSKHKLRW